MQRATSRRRTWRAEREPRVEPSPLRERVSVGESAIHGRGLFARAPIRRGGYIGTFEGPPALRDGRHVLWVEGGDGSLAGIRGRNELRFLNHSPRPNAEFRGADLYALRSIRMGEEITLHYGADWEEVG
jgi:SET domain-containing protein